MTGILLLGFGPLLIVVSVAALSFGLSAPAGDALQRSIVAACLIAFPAVCCGGALSLVYRWCFPRGEWRGAGMASSLVTVLALFTSPEYLSLLASGHVRGGLASAVVTAMSELSLGFGLALVVVMSCVLLIELPLRVACASVKGEGVEGLARSLRCAASILVASVGWVLLEDSAAERLQNLILALRG